MSEAPALIPGFPVTLSGKEYTIPPLSIRAAKIAQARRLDDFEKLAPSIGIIQELQAKGVTDVSGVNTENSDDIKKAIEVMRLASQVEQDTSIEIAYMAFQRNYPNVSRDEFEDICSISQAREISLLVFAGDLTTKKG